jgi:hypothetical protein
LAEREAQLALAGKTGLLVATRTMPTQRSCNFLQAVQPSTLIQKGPPR